MNKESPPPVPEEIEEETIYMQSTFMEVRQVINECLKDAALDGLARADYTR